MPAGQRRKPLAVHKLEGSFCKTEKTEPKPRHNASALRPPKDLSKEAREVWAETIRAAPDGMIKTLDQETLVTYCNAVVCVREAQRAFDDEGRPYSVIGPNGMMRVNPLIRVIDTQQKMILRCAGELGFTPTTRGRVRMDPNENPGEDDGFGKFGTN